MSREEIGSYLGVSLETVSRTISGLCKIGVLKKDNRSIEIINFDALKKLKRLPLGVTYKATVRSKKNNKSSGLPLSWDGKPYCWVDLVQSRLSSDWRVISLIKIFKARVSKEEIMDRRFISFPELASAHRPNATEIPDQPTSTDHIYHAALARFTGFVSPGSIALAWMDWWLHLSASPGKQQL